PPRRARTSAAGRSAVWRGPPGAARRAVPRRDRPAIRRAPAYAAARLGAARPIPFQARLAADRVAASRGHLRLPRAAPRRPPPQPFPCTSVFTSALKATEIL